MTYNYFLKDDLMSIEKILSIFFLIILIIGIILNLTGGKVIGAYLIVYVFGGLSVMVINNKILLRHLKIK